ncbi:MAG: hypothetical protein JWL95_345 [Gemmatimonadetes bacterium]|nr:hypothetical protein [Gemmatimonadota bacterium]
MAFKLTITFGGLCMFVQRSRPPVGLYVLMPKFEVEGMPEMKHCQVMITQAQNDNPSIYVPLDRGFEDKRDLADSCRRTADAPKTLEISKYTKRAVDPRCFDDEELAPTSLAWRIALPLGSTMRLPDTPPALPISKLLVPDSSNNYVSGDFVGLVKVDVDVKDGDGITIAGERLTAQGGALGLSLMNVPRFELDQGRIGTVALQEPMHVKAYYSLLQDYDPSIGLPIVFAATMPGLPTMPHANCPERGEHAHADAGRGVDPNNCTIATGCPVWPCP